jgi:anti-sigma regulatory factor (Ser/Thr protein kinase)
MANARKLSSLIKANTSLTVIISAVLLLELMMGIMFYAAQNFIQRTKGDITINMMSDGNTLHFQIIDAGVAFDPTAKQKTDTTLSVEDRQIGGLGILLVRELMDSINYERTGGKNILTLIKKL